MRTDVSPRVHRRRLRLSQRRFISLRGHSRSSDPRGASLREAMQILHQRAIGEVSSAENGDVPKTAAEAIADNVDYNAYHDCASAALLDPELAGDVQVQFATAHWLIQMARVLDEEKEGVFPV